MAAFTIGRVAREAGVKVDTVRFYERRGVLPQPPRSDSNYRLYSKDSVRRVRFIRRAQGLGFTLQEIKTLLELRASPEVHCGDVRRCAAEKIAEIEAKVKSLRSMRTTLARLADECMDRNGATSECPILDALEGMEGA